MIRTYTYDVTAADGAEELETVITGTQSRSRKILWASAELDDDVTLVGYFDQDKVLQAGLGVDVFGSKFVLIDRVLRAGETFKVGLDNDSGSSTTLQITVAVEEQD